MEQRRAALALLVAAIAVAVEGGFWSVPTEVIDVSTFASFTDIDNGTQTALNASNATAPAGEAMTAIKIRVYGGEDDPKGGEGLEFYGYPPPDEATGRPNSEPPQTEPCPGDPNEKCNLFTGSDGTTNGPIVYQVKASLPTLRYTLRKTGIRVPYSYLDHNPALLYCNDDKGDGFCNHGPAPYVSYDATQLLLNGQVQSNGVDPTVDCRGPDNSNLGNLIWYEQNSREDFVSPGCYACVLYNRDEFVDPQNASAELGHITVPHFCPFPISHPGQFPVESSGNYRQKSKCDKTQYVEDITADVASLEDYYYWCYALGIGYNSFYPDTCLNDPRNKPLEDPKNAAAFATYSTGKGVLLNHAVEYLEAYKCTLDAGGGIAPDCAPYNRVAKIADYVSCRLGEVDDDDGNPPARDCTLSVVNQVSSAVRFLTASCDAVDSGEALSPTSYTDAGQDPNGFKCPGDTYGHVRPIPTDSKFYRARCSSGCSDRNTVTHKDNSGGESKNDDSSDLQVNAILRDRATLENGPIMCDVYRVESRPRAVMNVTVAISAPGDQPVDQELSTDGISFVTSEVNKAQFSSRINRVEPTSSLGETIEGLIVICGTDDGQDVTDCGDIVKEGNIGGTDTCSVGRGILRGVPAVYDEAGNFKSPGNPTTNPWPYLIDQRSKDLKARCSGANQGTSYAEGNCPPPEFEGSVEDFVEADSKACPVPTATYLSTINCGRRVFWYYVPDGQTRNYGSECGQMGFRNSYAATPGGATFMCQQGDFTCTPGFGSPRYGTASASTQALSPCQEVGSQVRYRHGTVGDAHGSGGCNDPNAASPPLNLPPGWRTDGAASDYDPDAPPPGSGNDDGIKNVPNMWVDGSYLYVQPRSSDAATMTLEMEIYTDTQFGGSFQTYTNGKIVKNATETNYCEVTEDKASGGEFAVLFCNTNDEFGGTYTAYSQCGLPGDAPTDPDDAADDGGDDDDDGDSNYAVSIKGDPDITFPLGPAECAYQNWTFAVSGPLSAGQVYCETTLYPGSGIGLPKLDFFEFGCGTKAPTYQQTGHHVTYLTYRYEECQRFSLWCQLAYLPNWEQYTLYFFLFLLVALLVGWVYMELEWLKSTEEVKEALAKYSAEQREEETLEERRQAKLIGEEFKAAQESLAKGQAAAAPAGGGEAASAAK